MRIKNRKTTTIISSLLLVTLCTAAAGKTIYVDDDANGENNGSSWTNAYNYLQDALMTASPGDDIRVAQGIYKPNEFTLSKRPNLGRKETFQLKNGVAIRGGYAGIGEPNEDSRSIGQYVTILSGDLSGNDVDVNDPRNLLDESTRADNSYHVVTGSVTGETSVLDGFTIIAGSHHGMYNQTGSPTVANCTFRGNRAEHWGAGMFNSNSHPKLNNCTFSGNSTKWGGGIFNSESNPTLTNCSFSGNLAEYGGGMCNYGSNPTLNNCIFSENSAKWGGGLCNQDNSNPTLTDCTFSNGRSIGSKSQSYGGGIYNKSSNPTLTNCTFNGNLAPRNWKSLSYGAGMYNDSSDPALYDCTFNANSAHWGGGMFNDNSNPILINCSFDGNLVEWGGGIYNRSKSNPILTNCTFSGNQAKQWGGGACNSNSNPMLSNCIFTGNSAEYGGGMYNYQSNPATTNCTFGGNSAQYGGGVCSKDNSNPILTNCILWGNTSDLQISGRAIGSYCNIQGGWSGEGNIDADPLFVDPDGLDNIIGTQDDNLHISAGSPCIDAGDNSAVWPSVVADIDGNPRIINDNVDIGAYECPAVYSQLSRSSLIVSK